MHFNLFYKEYDYKPNLAAIKMFKESTGKDLWATLTMYMDSFTRSRANKESVSETIAKLASILDFVEAAHLFHCLGKQSNKALQISEVEDAMFHAGILPSIGETDLCEPYPFVIFNIALEVSEYHLSLAREKKPQAHF